MSGHTPRRDGPEAPVHAGFAVLIALNVLMLVALAAWWLA